MKTYSILAAAVLFVQASSSLVSGFSFEQQPPQQQKQPNTDRRSFLLGGGALFTGVITAAAATASSPLPANAAAPPAALGSGTVVGREIDTFNSLIYNFKNVDLGGGLDASTLKEPSVPFVEFGEKMKNGQVEFVEFMAPSGDVAYVTFKGSEGGKIRIGQGYPINKKGSWSTPDYVIRSVSNFGVPYKFTVPALAAYNSKVAR